MYNLHIFLLLSILTSHKIIYCIEDNLLTKYVQRRAYNEIEKVLYENSKNHKKVQCATDEFPDNFLCKILKDIEIDKSHLPLGPVRGYTVERSVGSGGQGSIYLIRSPSGGRFIKKISDKPYTLLMEYNAAKAFEIHPMGDWHKFHIISLNYGGFPDSKHTNYTMESKITNTRYYFQGGKYCLDMTYVEGETLVDLVNELPQPYRVSVLKQFYVFIILILKQLQAVHFTLNEKPVFHGQFYKRHSYTNYHSDIHSKNILIDFKGFPNSSYYVPILIDYGLSFNNFYGSMKDFAINKYNYILRKRRKINLPYHLSKGRIFNVGQRIDFCSVAILSILLIMKKIYLFRPNISVKCRHITIRLYNILSHRGEGKHVIQFIPCMSEPVLRPILPLLNFLFTMSLPYKTYKSWRDLNYFFQPFRNHSISPLN
ncbi:hypothetical protein SNEBB_005874 [Seison nebaliae]|nr:hypothetical protein SNEBB_005874 [Seison nebaliae]